VGHRVREVPVQDRKATWPAEYKPIQDFDPTFVDKVLRWSPSEVERYHVQRRKAQGIPQSRRADGF